MDINSTIALAAGIASFLSALYSRWAAKAAQRANEISVHNEKLKIYLALREFRSVIATLGAGFPNAELWKFNKYVLLSEFYFPKTNPTL